MRKFYAALSIIIMFTNVFSQEKTKEFKPSGTPFIKIYSNFHSNFTSGEVHNAFEIQRTYLGYSYKLNERISGKVTLDVGDPGVGKLQMTAYLKNAYLQYKSKRLTAKFGLIGRYQFKMQEKQWGGRYLYKSFQDQYKLGHSADLGLFVSYKIHEKLSLDIAIENGDGYKSLENDSVLKYGGGLTISPIKGLDTRVYYDVMGKDTLQQTLSFYVGYRNKKLKFGAEYNKQLNHKMIANEDFGGFSFYGSYKIEKIRLFGRFDKLSSVQIDNETDPWNFADDGQAILAGIEYIPVKGLKITPNYRAWIPANGDSLSNIAYLSFEIKF